MNWTIGLGDGRCTYPIMDALSAGWAWDLLSEKAQAAIAEAWRNDRDVTAHPNTMHALQKHGFITWGQGYNGVLTDAGVAVARWMVPPESSAEGNN